MGTVARTIGGLALALMLGACGSSAIELQSGPPTQDLRACVRTGGTIEARGRGGRAMCVHRYADGGKSCSTKTDCRGRCIAALDANGEMPKAGQPAAGHCQADDRLFGCYAEVLNGKARPGICVD